jgi:acyl carrier protein
MLKRNGRSEIENKIKDLLVSELKVNRSVIDASSSITPLLGQGIGLDSVETMALILAIEEEFEISIPDSDLKAPLFENMEILTQYVLRKVTENRP